MNYLLAIAGLLLLFFGAKLFIHGASSLGKLAGLSPIVIGLTIVAYGTSTPELVVSVTGSWTGQLDLALGNVIGSNIFNVLFILGLSAACVPLVVNQRLLQYDVPLIFTITVVVFGFSVNGSLTLWEGGVLFLVLAGYTAWAVVESQSEPPEIQEEYTREYPLSEMTTGSTTGFLFSGLILLMGLALLIFGSRVFTQSISEIARSIGISEAVIALTIVSAGTSLPEVGTSVLAALRGETDIAVGNVIGSNFFNLTGVLGLSVLSSGNGLPASEAILQFDMLILLVVSVLCLPILFTGHRISRWEGGLFVLYYVFYVLSLLSPRLHPLVSRSLFLAMYGFVLPLTTLTIGIGLYRHFVKENGNV